MKLIEGENLAEIIERRGALPEEEALVYADQLLDALAHCHAQGVIHRDVKPQNVIIRPVGPAPPRFGGAGGGAVLVDFGLVKLWDPDDPHTKTAMRGMGTPEYAPPEQYDVGPGHTDPRSDVYGLGATLYHALTGQAPPTVTQRIASRSAFQSPRALNKRVSPATEAAVLRAMELTVEDRFSTVQEMAAALRSRTVTLARPVAPTPQPAQATPPAPAAAPARPRGVPVWAWALGGLVVLALVVGLAIGVTRLVEGGSAPMPTPTLSPTPVATPTPMPTHKPTRTPTRTPTSPPTATPTPRPTSTSAHTPTRRPTNTPTRTPTPAATATHTRTSPTLTRRPTYTPTPPAVALELVAPAQGCTFPNPITFQWRGSLSAGQAYQVTARHPGSNYAIQSELLTDQNWSAHLPAERYGEWRWTVSVVEDGSAVITSSERMFWFQPGGGGGGDGNGGEGTSTPPPP
jgi:serine/threonine protein kinase